MEFKLCVHPDLNAIRLREFSRSDTVGEYFQTMLASEDNNITVRDTCMYSKYYQGRTEKRACNSPYSQNHPTSY